MVFKDSKNQAAAWKFIEWLSQPEVQLSWWLASSDLPLVKSAWDDPSLANDPKMSVIGEQLKSGKSPPQVLDLDPGRRRRGHGPGADRQGRRGPGEAMKSLQSHGRLHRNRS